MLLVVVVCCCYLLFLVVVVVVRVVVVLADVVVFVLLDMIGFIVGSVCSTCSSLKLQPELFPTKPTITRTVATTQYIAL